MIIYYIFVNIGLAAVVLWGRNEAKHFLSAYSAIDNMPALEAFKRLARRNMVVALIYLPVGLVSILWSIYLVSQFHLVGLAVVLAVQIPLFLLSQNLKKLEILTRSLDSSDATIKEEHQRVSESWVKKALPDF
jgi:hypothetical protein